ncbi:MAG: L-threonylcarbamoyladenylate synthase [Actinomycetota bacterium]|nr:L-threonylcarbamoyladenylate synthase [Actinomycetota bacterium]
MPETGVVLTTDVDAAAAALASGALVVLPTETVYGLGADATNPTAVGRVYAVKGRPATHPVIVHVASADALTDWARDVPGYAYQLVEACWPGPLTVVLPRGPAVGGHVTGGADTVALRAPAHPMTRAVLVAFGTGVAAPSANRFGRVSPTTAQHALDELSGLLDPERDLALDGGPCRIGVESTIVDATGPRPRLLRPGAVPAASVAAITGLDVDLGPGGPRAPGTLPAHYAPAARVLAVEPQAAADTVGDQLAAGHAVGLIAPADLVDTPPGATRLVVPEDDAAYAHQLYGALRHADQLGLDVVVAVLPPDSGLGSAVRDRLRRAAFGTRPTAS